MCYLCQCPHKDEASKMCAYGYVCARTYVKCLAPPHVSFEVPVARASPVTLVSPGSELSGKPQTR